MFGGIYLTAYGPINIALFSLQIRINRDSEERLFSDNDIGDHKGKNKK